MDEVTTDDLRLLMVPLSKGSSGMYGQLNICLLYTSIAISIRNNELFTKEWQCRISIPTQSPTYLAKTAFALFAKNYQWEHPIRSVTVRAIPM